MVSADFSRSSGFQGAEFYAADIYKANFQCANLTGTKFDGANMGDVQSVGPQFNDQFVADWWGSKAWQRLQYVVVFDGAILAKASFQGTSVAGASFEYADLTGTQFINTDLSRADFRNAFHLDKAVFINDCSSGPFSPLGLDDSFVKGLRAC
jgi:uncharacterized protein YjbI with pentapeptide repeats